MRKYKILIISFIGVIILSLFLLCYLSFQNYTLVSIQAKTKNSESQLTMTTPALPEIVEDNKIKMIREKSIVKIYKSSPIEKETKSIKKMSTPTPILKNQVETTKAIDQNTTTIIVTIITSLTSLMGLMITSIFAILSNHTAKSGIKPKTRRTVKK